MDISYAIHIGASREKLWDALTSSEALRKNWGRIESQWTVGSRVTEVNDSGKVLWQGEVLHSDRPGRLSYTFDVIGSGEPPTTVTFELSRSLTEVAPDTSVVRLTLTQSGFPENSKLRAECSRAWNEILSSVKTYLETGRPLPFVWNTRDKS